jgi:hypothetical protein
LVIGEVTLLFLVIIMEKEGKEKLLRNSLNSNNNK